jgi:rod shape-determining protein MreD
MGMSRSVAGAIALGALFFVLQHVLLQHFTVFGVHPELMLLFAVCCGLAGGPNYGVVAGFAAGLITDAFLVSPMGLCAFAFALTGYLAGVTSDDTASTPSATFLTAGGFSALGLTLVFVLGGMLGQLHSSFGHAVAVIFVGSVVNAVLGIPVRRILRTVRASRRELVW